MFYLDERFKSKGAVPFTFYIERTGTPHSDRYSQLNTLINIEERTVEIKDTYWVFYKDRKYKDKKHNLSYLKPGKHFMNLCPEIKITSEDLEGFNYAIGWTILRYDEDTGRGVFLYAYDQYLTYRDNGDSIRARAAIIKLPIVIFADMVASSLITNATNFTATYRTIRDWAQQIGIESVPKAFVLELTSKHQDALSDKTIGLLADLENLNSTALLFNNDSEKRELERLLHIRDKATRQTAYTRGSVYELFGDEGSIYSRIGEPNYFIEMDQIIDLSKIDKMCRIHITLAKTALVKGLTKRLQRLKDQGYTDWQAWILSSTLRFNVGQHYVIFYTEVETLTYLINTNGKQYTYASSSKLAERHPVLNVRTYNQTFVGNFVEKLFLFDYQDFLKNYAGLLDAIMKVETDKEKLQYRFDLLVKDPTEEPEDLCFSEFRILRVVLTRKTRHKNGDEPETFATMFIWFFTYHYASRTEGKVKSCASFELQLNQNGNVTGAENLVARLEKSLAEPEV